MTEVVHRVGSQARVEIGPDGTDVFNPDGIVLLHIDPPEDYQLAEPVYSELVDEAYIKGYVEGYNHRQIGLAPKYREGDTVR
jgi:hypothetical protein